MKFSGKRTFALITVAALALVACSDDDKTGTADNGGGNCESLTGDAIRIVENGWTASALEANILKQLVESQLCVPAEIVKVDENAMFAGMADGTVDLVAEIWPSGITEDEQAFIDDGSVVDMGELGMAGQIGWFVPDYVVADHPELATWEGLKDPEIAKLFATAETGDDGRFLGTDPSFSQWDEALVSGLELPFQVVFSGAEATTIAEVKTAVEEQRPIILYYWTPSAAVGQYKLVQVALPEHTDGCETADTVTCGYPEDVLFKLASAKLEAKNAKVWSMVQKLSIDIDTMLALLPKVEIDGQDPDAVAAEWIAANEAVWSAWFA